MLIDVLVYATENNEWKGQMNKRKRKSKKTCRQHSKKRKSEALRKTSDANKRLEKQAI